MSTCRTWSRRRAAAPEALECPAPRPCPGPAPGPEGAEWSRRAPGREALGAQPQHLSPWVPRCPRWGGRGLEWGAGRKQGRCRDSNPGPAVLGVPPPAPFAFSCSFSHRLKGEKQNLDTAMSCVQEKKHLRRLRTSQPPGSCLPLLTPLSRHSWGTHGPSASRPRVSLFLLAVHTAAGAQEIRLAD